MKHLALFLAIAAASSAAAKDKPFERIVEVRVAVNEEGRVADADAVGELPEAVTRLAEQAVAGVLFEPARVDGKPASSRTSLDVNLRFTPQDDGEVVAKVLEVGPSKPVFQPPLYPQRAAERGYGGHLVMEMHLTPEGRVDVGASGLRAITLWKGSRKLEDSNAYREAYVAETMRAMANWRPAIEEVDGAPVHTVWLVPVTFCPPARPGVCDRIKADAPKVQARAASTDGIRLASIKQLPEPAAGP